MSSLCFSFANVDSYDYINGPTLYVWKDESTPLYQAVRSGKYPLVDTHFCNNLIGPDVIQCNAGHMRVDTTDPWAISDAMILGRQKATQYLEAMKDVRPTTFSNAFVVRTASLLGVRDSRRIEGDYIFTVDIFNEGVDIPEINQVIMLRPTQSPVVFIQQLGRGLRKYEGKE